MGLCCSDDNVIPIRKRCIYSREKNVSDMTLSERVERKINGIHTAIETLWIPIQRCESAELQTCCIAAASEWVKLKIAAYYLYSYKKYADIMSDYLLKLLKENPQFICDSLMYDGKIVPSLLTQFCFDMKDKNKDSTLLDYVNGSGAVNWIVKIFEQEDELTLNKTRYKDKKEHIKEELKILCHLSVKLVKEIIKELPYPLSRQKTKVDLLNKSTPSLLNCPKICN
jgi:hypothetical protein